MARNYPLATFIGWFKKPEETVLHPSYSIKTRNGYVIQYFLGKVIVKGRGLSLRTTMEGYDRVKLSTQWGSMTLYPISVRDSGSQITVQKGEERVSFGSVKQRWSSIVEYVCPIDVQTYSLCLEEILPEHFVGEALPLEVQFFNHVRIVFDFSDASTTVEKHFCIIKNKSSITEQVSVNTFEMEKIKGLQFFYDTVQKYQEETSGELLSLVV